MYDFLKTHRTRRTACRRSKVGARETSLVGSYSHPGKRWWVVQVRWLWGSGPQWGQFCPGHIWQCLDTLGCHSGELGCYWHLTGGGQRWCQEPSNAQGSRPQWKTFRHKMSVVLRLGNLLQAVGSITGNEWKKMLFFRGISKVTFYRRCERWKGRNPES